MAIIQCTFSSEVLSRSMSMTVILPQSVNNEDKRYPTLYLLHGFSDDHTAWTRSTSLERYAEHLGLAIVMPGVDNSYYSDMVHGGNYWKFITEELPATARSFFPLSDKREDNFVAGNSMGGFGALKWGLSHPQAFCAIASLSGVTDMVYHLHNVRTEGPEDKRKTLSLVFGEENIAQTPNDLLWQLEQVSKDNVPQPKLFQACGTEDFLYEHNMRFYKKCQDTDLDLTAIFNEGDHNWEYWDEKIQEVLHWLPIQN